MHALSANMQHGKEILSFATFSVAKICHDADCKFKVFCGSATNLYHSSCSDPALLEWLPHDE